MWVGTASAVEDPPWANEDEDTTAVSGPIEYKDFNSLGNAITECPQAGLKGGPAKPLRHLARDNVEQMSDAGGNIRANQDYSCMPQDETSRRGGPGDPGQPGDGTVGFIQDNDAVLNGSVPGFDKEWITAGPRPDGVQPQCFTPLAHAPIACNPDQVGSDRLYVTYSLFSAAGSAQIFLSYSDDRAHSWSPAHFIAGAASFCVGRPGNECDDSQGSQPTVNPTTGEVWVGFINGDTTDEDQYLVVHSTDGGVTFSPPSRVDTLYDVNEPRGVNGRSDCVARGQGSTRAVPTNSCFRFDPIMNSIAADKRGGGFANDVYVVLADNRNGTIRDSNNDVFFYKSTDGGTTWIGPTRGNNVRR